MSTLKRHTAESPRRTEAGGIRISTASMFPHSRGTSVERLAKLPAIANRPARSTPDVRPRSVGENGDIWSVSSILIVDGDRDSRQSMATALSLEGLDVVTAASGREALARTIHGRRPLVITELELPDTSGLDLVHCLQARGLEPLFIFVTSSATVSRAVEAMQHGALTVLEKPFAIESLKAMLANRLRPAAAIPHAGGDDALRFKRPRSVADRWAAYVWNACCAAGGDLKTLADWARCLGVSYSSLCETCRLLEIQPHDARDLTRMLRALVLSVSERCRADVFLDISDRRTLQRLLARAGVDPTTGSPTPDEFLRRQMFIPARNQGLISLRVLMSVGQGLRAAYADAEQAS